MGPRVSPDGHAVAFLAFVGELTQVAVMKPETGNWTVLTHNTARGSVNGISWSPDGARLYYGVLNRFGGGRRSFSLLSSHSTSDVSTLALLNGTTTGQTVFVVKGDDGVGFSAERTGSTAGRV